MNKSTYAKIFSIGLFCLFFTQLLYSPIQNESINSTTNETLSTSEMLIAPKPAIDESNYLSISFFENVSGVIEWIFSKMYDNTSVQTQIRYFGESNQTGDVITDGKHYFEDFAVFLDGIINFYESGTIIPSYLDYQYTAPFLDNNASSRGYYSWVSQDWQTNSTIKDFYSNAQLVLTFADWLIQNQYQETAYGADTIVNNQWDLLNDTFWDEGNGAFNHSTVDNTKYLIDQFIAAICGFQIHRAQIGIDTAVKSEANSTATTIMNRMVDPSNFGDGTKAFYTSKNNDFTSTIDPKKNIATNAYGIWALVEWYLESGGNAWDNLKLVNASRVYDRLESLWNSTYKMYMTQAVQNFESISDYSISLKDNAIMIMALKQLFQVTGNFTYFRRIMDMIDGIQTYFRDPIYGNYYKSIYPGLDSNPVTNTNKSFSAHCYLFSALRRVATLSNYLTTTLETNATSYIHSYDNTFVINTSVFFNFDGLNPNYPALIKKTELQNATCFVTFRYPNNTLVFNNSYTATPQGRVNFTLPLETSYPTGQYSVSVRINYTGVFTQFNTTYFKIDSGVHVKNNTLPPEIICGDMQVLNLTVNDTRRDNISVSVKVSGDSIVNQTFSNQNLNNQSLNYLNLSIQTLNETKFGLKNVSVEIYYGGLLFDQYYLSFTIINPIKLLKLQNPTTVFRGKAINLSINIQNLASKLQNLRINVSGDDFIVNSLTYSLNGDSSAIILLNVNTTSSVSYGKTAFLVNVTRVSDGEVYYSEWIEIEVVPLVKLLAIQKPTISSHGEQSFVILKLQNNLDTNQIIQYTIDNGTKIAITLVPGVNFVKILIGNGFPNPYQYGEELFELSILDGEGTEIYYEIITVTVGFSPYGTFIGYFLPIMIPLIGIIIFRYLDLENKKRLA